MYCEIKQTRLTAKCLFNNIHRHIFINIINNVRQQLHISSTTTGLWVTLGCITTQTIIHFSYTVPFFSNHLTNCKSLNCVAEFNTTEFITRTDTSLGTLPTLSGKAVLEGARCRSVAHGAMGRRIHPSWGGPIELFLVPASSPRLVYQRLWYVLSCLWDSAYKRTLAANRKE